MIEQNFENFLDLGSSKLRLGIFDRKINKLDEDFYAMPNGTTKVKVGIRLS